MSPYRQPAVMVNWACSVAVASPPTHTLNVLASVTQQPAAAAVISANTGHMTLAGPGGGEP